MISAPTSATFGWKLGAFHTDDENDILDVPSPDQQGFGYFQNVGATRRQGVEAEVNFKSDKLTLYASYAFVDATFRDALTLASNSPFADANGDIHVAPGDQIPAIPRHRAKVGAEYALTRRSRSASTQSASAASISSATPPISRASCPHTPSSTPTRPTRSRKTVQIYARVENILDNRYYTYGTFFDTAARSQFRRGRRSLHRPALAEPRTAALLLRRHEGDVLRAAR